MSMRSTRCNGIPHGPLRGNYLSEDGVEIASDTPLRIVRLKLPQVRNVADMIALAGFFDVFPIQFLAGQFSDLGNGLEHGNTVSAAATQVVNLTWTRVGSVFFDGTDYIVTVNVVAHLLGFVAKDGISAAAQRYFNQIRKEAVEFNAGVRGPGQAATAKNAGIHAKVAAVFLGDKVGGCF